MVDFNLPLNDNKVESWLDDLSELIDVNDDFISTDLDFLGSDGSDNLVDSNRQALTLNPSNIPNHRCLTGRKKKDAELSMSKNAVLARENRFKKKKFIDDILRKNKFLSGQNSHLKSKCEKYDRNVYSLRKEVSYLKNIIHNQSTLSKLLKSIPSLVKDQFDESSDELIDVIDYNRNECPDVRPPNPSCGICLHVANNTVLLEMCHSCSSKAQLAHKNVMKLSN